MEKNLLIVELQERIFSKLNSLPLQADLGTASKRISSVGGNIEVFFNRIPAIINNRLDFLSSLNGFYPLLHISLTEKPTPIILGIFKTSDEDKKIFMHCPGTYSETEFVNDIESIISYIPKMCSTVSFGSLEDLDKILEGLLNFHNITKQEYLVIFQTMADSLTFTDAELELGAKEITRLTVSKDLVSI